MDLTEVTDQAMAQKYNVPLKTKLMTYGFVMVTVEETEELRARNARTIMGLHGQKVEFHDNMPYIDVD